jgi:hypothetical protein
MGLLLSFAFRNFSMSGAFKSIRGGRSADVDTSMQEVAARLGVVRRPGALRLFWQLTPHLIGSDRIMRYGVLRLLELISNTTHRNHVVLSSFDMAKPVLERFCAARNDSSVSEMERNVLQKLLRRLLDMGATPPVARLLFQTVVKPDETLDAEILEVIRHGMKSRWLEHFSMESPASLTLTEEGVKGLVRAPFFSQVVSCLIFFLQPVMGFTFMVRLNLEYLYFSNDSQIWVWIKELPTTTHPIFSARINTRTMVSLSLRGDGKLELLTSSNRDVGVFRKSNVHKARWTHITLVHYPHRVSNPTIRKTCHSIRCLSSYHLVQDCTSTAC